MGRKCEEVAEGEKLASKGGKKAGIGCVFEAWKCSSRAENDDNRIVNAPLSLIQDGVMDSEWTDFGAPGTSFSANAFRLPSSPEIGQPKEPPTRKLSRFDDTATKEVEIAVDHIPRTVSRIRSEDTYESHETPPVSNLDPSRVPTAELSPKANRLKLDAICSNYFNTPVGQPMHSSAPLGDSISPIESPIEEEDEEDEEQEETSTNFNDARAALQIPRMDDRNVRAESEASSLLGEALVEEKKTADEQLLLNPDTASMTIGYQEVKAMKSKDDEVSTRVRPSNQATHRKSWTSESSSYSSVSSFSALRSNTPLSFEEGAKPLAPHSFFWRTYPRVTVTSVTTYSRRKEMKPKKQRLPPKIDEEQAMDVPTLASSSGSKVRQSSSPTYVASDVGSDVECSPFLDSEVVRKLLRGGKPYRLEKKSSGKLADQQSLYPQVTRPRQVVQSLTSMRLPAVFRGEEIQRPEDINLAMG
eukprot:scaffold1019_cov123-Cylindrotheca_fusiformis.AAC.5